MTQSDCFNSVRCMDLDTQWKHRWKPHVFWITYQNHAWFSSVFSLDLKPVPKWEPAGTPPADLCLSERTDVELLAVACFPILVLFRFELKTDYKKMMIQSTVSSSLDSHIRGVFFETSLTHMVKLVLKGMVRWYPSCLVNMLMREEYPALETIN